MEFSEQEAHFILDTIFKNRYHKVPYLRCLESLCKNIKNLDKQLLTGALLLRYASENILIEDMRKVIGELLIDRESWAPLYDRVINERKVQVIMLKGIPGCGKTTLGKVLASNAGKDGIYLDQDMQKKGKSAAKDYLNSIENAIHKGYNRVVLGKCHHLVSNRQSVYDILPPYCDITIAEFYHPESNEELKGLCLERIKNRKGHVTLTAEKAPEVLDMFIKQTEDLTSDEKKIAIQLDVTKTVDEWVKELKLGECQKAVLKEDEKDIKQFSYAAYEIDDMKAIMDALDDEIKKHPNIIIQKKFHVTIEYFGNIQSPIKYHIYDDLKDKDIKITCIGYCVDDNGLAVAVQRDIVTMNHNSHITIGNAKGVKPVYSNELIGKSKIIPFKEPIVVIGRFAIK